MHLRTETQLNPMFCARKVDLVIRDQLRLFQAPHGADILLTHQTTENLFYQEVEKSIFYNIEKIHRYILKIQRWIVKNMVEPRGIEPLSESNLEGLSPGAVCYLHSLIPAGTNTLWESVAS